MCFLNIKKRVRDFFHPNSPIEMVLENGFGVGDKVTKASLGIRDVLNAFLMSMVKYALYGILIVVVVGFVFYFDNIKNGEKWLFDIKTDLKLDGQTFGGLVSLIVAIAISFGGAMVAIMISWRSMEISQEIKILEEQARDRDNARFFFDMASDVKKELDNLSERWSCSNKKVDDFFVEAKKLREKLERRFCEDISGSFPDLNLSSNCKGWIDNSGEEFERSAKDFCAVLKESGASLVSDPDFDLSRRSDYVLNAYIFSMRWKLADISAFEKWKAENQSSRSEFDWPDFSQISEVYSESRDEQIDFVFGLATIAFSLSRCRDEDLDIVALVASTLQVVKNITWFEDDYLRNSIKNFYFNQELTNQVVDKLITLGDYSLKYRPKCYSVISDIEFPGNFDFSDNPDLKERFRRFFFSCFVWGKMISGWNEFRDDPKNKILLSMKEWSNKIESSSGVLKMREFLKGFDGVDCDSSIGIIKEIKNNLKERYEKYPSQNDAIGLKRRIGGELDIPDF